jgi:hypothetical protein
MGGRGDDYYHFQGTSMAAPHVSAAAALLMAQGVEDAAQVRDILVQSTAAKEPKLQYGSGILSADGATSLVVTRRWFDFAKDVIVFLISIIFFRTSKFQPAGFGGVAIGLSRFHMLMRVALALAVWVGAFIPVFISRWAGADSMWNLIGFSAFLPFLLFWEWEKGIGSKIVAAFAAGVALCIAWAMLTATLPFTHATFGGTALPWTIANFFAAMTVAALAWKRGRQ